MKSFQLEGVARAERDAEVLVAMEAAADGAGDGASFRIGLRNEAGEIYRVVIAESRQEYEHVSDTLYDMGWQDELGEDAVAGDYQAIFSCCR